MASSSSLHSRPNSEATSSTPPPSPPPTTICEPAHISSSNNVSSFPSIPGSSSCRSRTSSYMLHYLISEKHTAESGKQEQEQEHKHHAESCSGRDYRCSRHPPSSSVSHSENSSRELNSPSSSSPSLPFRALLPSPPPLPRPASPHCCPAFVSPPAAVSAALETAQSASCSEGGLVGGSEGEGGGGGGGEGGGDSPVHHSRGTAAVSPAGVRTPSLAAAAAAGNTVEAETSTAAAEAASRRTVGGEDRRGSGARACSVCHPPGGAFSCAAADIRVRSPPAAGAAAGAKLLSSAAVATVIVALSPSCITAGRGRLSGDGRGEGEVPPPPLCYPSASAAAAAVAAATTIAIPTALSCSAGRNQGTSDAGRGGGGGVGGGGCSASCAGAVFPTSSSSIGRHHRAAVASSSSVGGGGVVGVGGGVPDANVLRSTGIDEPPSSPNHRAAMEANGINFMLPDSTLSDIFDKLSLRDRNACRQVCKRWFVIESSSRRELKLRRCPASLGTDYAHRFRLLLKRFQNVHSLSINELRGNGGDACITKEALAMLGTALPRLDELQLVLCGDIPREAFSHLAKLSSLRALRIASDFIYNINSPPPPSPPPPASFSSSAAAAALMAARGGGGVAIADSALSLRRPDQHFAVASSNHNLDVVDGGGLEEANDYAGFLLPLPPPPPPPPPPAHHHQYHPQLFLEMRRPLLHLNAQQQRPPQWEEGGEEGGEEGEEEGEGNDMAMVPERKKFANGAARCAAAGGVAMNGVKEEAACWECDPRDRLGLAMVLPNLPRLLELDLGVCRHANDTWLSIIARHCTVLESLSLANQTVRQINGDDLLDGANTITDKGMAELGLGCPRLKSLSLIGFFEAVGAVGMIKFLRRRSATFERLRLDHCMHLVAPSLHAIIDNGLREIKVIHIENESINHEDFPLLTRLELDGLAATCQKLETLNLHNVAYDQLGLGNMLRSCQQCLRFLRLSNCCTSLLEPLTIFSTHAGAAAGAAASSASSPPSAGAGAAQITELDLTGNMQMEDSLLKDIAASCPSLINFRCQNPGSPLTSEGIAHLAAGCRRLTHLQLDYRGNCDDALAALGAYCKDLVELKLSPDPIDINGEEVSVTEFITSGDVSDEGVAALARNCPHLEVLDLSECPNLTLTSFRAIAQRCRKLRTLALEPGNQVQQCLNWNKGLTCVANHCPNLTSLSISRCYVGWTALRALAKECRELKTLRLVECRGVDDVGMEELSRHARSLAQLIMSNSRVTAEGMRAVERGCTELRELSVKLRRRHGWMEEERSTYNFDWFRADQLIDTIQTYLQSNILEDWGLMS